MYPLATVSSYLHNLGPNVSSSFLVWNEACATCGLFRLPRRGKLIKIQAALFFSHKHSCGSNSLPRTIFSVFKWGLFGALHIYTLVYGEEQEWMLETPRPRGACADPVFLLPAPNLPGPLIPIDLFSLKSGCLEDPRKLPGVWRLMVWQEVTEHEIHKHNMNHVFSSKSCQF